MSFVDSSIWASIKKNEHVYSLIHNTVGKWLTKHALKEKEKKLKKLGIESINEIDTALSSNCSVFYVDFGTLLGIIREGHLISWDDDIDFGIHITDCFTWEDLKELLNGLHFSLVKQFRYNGAITEQTYYRNGLFIDFFNHFSDDDRSFYYVYYKKNDYEYDDENLLHARVTYTRKIQNNKLLEFDGGKVHVPENPEDYLEDVYGADWKIPKKDWNPDSMKNIEWLEEFGMLETFND